MLKKVASVLIILAGCVWPFAVHGVAMRQLALRLSQDPRYWIIYELFLGILPCPALIFTGFHLLLRDQMPYPASAKIASIGSAIVFLVTAIVFFVFIAGIGFKVPLPVPPQ